LKMIDIDGRFTYSNVVVIRMNRTNSPITVYPNPAIAFVNVELGSNAKGDYDLQLIDASGKTVKAIAVKNAQGNQLVTIQRGGIANGMYVLKITSSHYNETSLNKIIFK